MVLSSTHTRLTRTSSDLRMLSAILLPPSPILKADDFLIASTSGEIPILLEGAVHVGNVQLFSFSDLPRLCDVVKEPGLFDKLDTTAGKTRNLARGDEALIENWMYRESEDVPYTPSDFPNGYHSEPPSNSCPVGAISGELKDSTRPNDVLAGDSDARCSSVLGDCSMPFVKLEGLQDPRVFCPSTMELSTTPVAPKEDHDDGQLLMTATFHTYATLPTPTFAPPSPSASVDVISPLSSPVGRQCHRRPLERARAVRFPGRPRSPRLQVNKVESNLVRNGSPPTKYASTSLQWQLTDSAPPPSTHLDTADTRVIGMAHPFVKHVVLPEELSWIKHMAIELWIDQERFRAVRSCMQLMGYSSRTRSLHPYESAENSESGVTAGVAEFMPAKRETFAFHYATLDSPPTLRMVSVAGDESRDYISRQATLSVKANGVYTVLGTETFVASILNSDAHGLRLCWKFDYLVGDRKVDGTGRTPSGEKTLTPLTFSCSPYLLHPLHGKKAGLMHIMKKSLVPKLGSQKLEPPASYSVLPRASRYLSTRDAAAHARSRSDASSKREHYRSLSKSPLDANAGGGAVLGTSHMPRVRRRRASSAGENSLTVTGSKSRDGGMVTLKDVGMFMPATTLFR